MATLIGGEDSNNDVREDELELIVENRSKRPPFQLQDTLSPVAIWCFANVSFWWFGRRRGIYGLQM